MSRAQSRAAAAPTAASSPASLQAQPAKPAKRGPRAQRTRADYADYVERALLLWPRLDRARLRKFADDPVRIASVVGRRTSQPLEAILAMLTRQGAAPLAPTESTAGFESGRAETARLAIHVVRNDDERELDALILA